MAGRSPGSSSPHAGKGGNGGNGGSGNGGSGNGGSGNGGGGNGGGGNGGGGNGGSGNGGSGNGGSPGGRSPGSQSAHVTTVTVVPPSTPDPDPSINSGMDYDNNPEPTLSINTLFYGESTPTVTTTTTVTPTIEEEPVEQIPVEEVPVEEVPIIEAPVVEEPEVYTMCVDMYRIVNGNVMATRESVTVPQLQGYLSQGLYVFECGKRIPSSEEVKQHYGYVEPTIPTTTTTTTTIPTPGKFNTNILVGLVAGGVLAVPILDDLLKTKKRTTARRKKR